MSETPKPAFADCALPANCACAKRGYVHEDIGGCLVPALRRYVADLGITDPAILARFDLVEPPAPPVGRYRGYLIDPVARTVGEVGFDTPADMVRLIDCDLFTVAFHYASGDVLFVDDEGLNKPMPSFFQLDDRTDQLLAGKGLLVGRERETAELSWEPPAMTIDDLRQRVRFVSEEG